MWVSIYFFVVFCLSIAYLFFLYNIFSLWEKTPELEVSKTASEERVSVVIAARNEERNISTCIHSILQNDYQGKFEVIVVNDHSTDNTLEVLQNINDARVKVANLPADKMGKKSALSHGIELAQGEIILCTDADCIVGKNWIVSMIAALHGKHFVTGPLRLKEMQSALGAFQILDLSAMMAITAYGINTSSFYLANGANLGFRKKAFLNLNGYKGNEKYASGDDVFLIQKMAKELPDKVSFVKSRTAIVETLGVEKVKDFFSQRKRWATKSGAYTDRGLQFVLGFVFLFNVMLVVNLVVGPFFVGGLFFIGLIQLMIKVIMDYLLLSNLSTYFKTEEAMKYFFRASLWAVVNIIFSGCVALFAKNYSWKGRRQQ